MVNDIITFYCTSSLMVKTFVDIDVIINSQQRRLFQRIQFAGVVSNSSESSPRLRVRHAHAHVVKKANNLLARSLCQ